VATFDDLKGPEAPTDVLDTVQAGSIVIRGSAIRTVGYVAGILFSLASVPLLVRHLGVVRFGEYVLVTSLVAVAGGLTEGGLGAIAVREYAVQTGAQRDLLLRNLLGLRLVLTLLGSAGAIAFAFAAGYDRTLVLGTGLAGLGLLLLTTQNLLSASLLGALRFGWITVVELLRQIATVGLIVVLVAAGAGLLPFFAVSIPAGLLALALTGALIRSAMPFRPAFHLGEWRRLLRGVFVYAAATATYVAYFRMAIIAMSLITSKLETGYFATSFRILEVFVAIPALLVGAVFPVLARAARDDLERLRYGVSRVFEISVLVGVWFALAIVLGAEFMIEFVAGEQSRPSVAVLQIQGPAIVATFVAMACGFPLLALRRHRALLLSNLLALVTGAILIALLVPPFEARGAAVATVGAEVALALSQAIFLIRARSDIRLPLGFIPPVLLATGLAALVILVPGLHGLARVAIATAVYFGVLALLGRIPPEARDALLRRRPTETSA
jgi:O-antigen/teichoic acid export membrane protein